MDPRVAAHLVTLAHQHGHWLMGYRLNALTIMRTRFVYTNQLEILPRAAHSQAADAQGGLADADGDGLASFAAGADAII